MADSNTPPNGRPDNPIDPPSPLDLGGQVPVEPMEVEAPRRAASAQFIVEGDVGTEAALRTAMDPANQSLADALRLSYRVLQVVILILVVLFIFSGWKQVQEGQTGILSVWGKIAESDGDTALTPGLKFSKWPYPAGEFILFQEQNRPVDVSQTFWPGIRPGQTFEQMVQRASLNDRLRPGRDGSLLTADGELAHLQVSASYAVADPAKFVQHVRHDRDDADRLVQLSLQRAVVHAGLARSLSDIVTDNTTGLAGEIQRRAQDLLDDVDSGLLLQSATVPGTSAPLAVQKTVSMLSVSQEAAEGAVANAQEQRIDTLTAVAGGDYQNLLDLVRAYEATIDAGDRAASDAAMEAINTALDDSTGEMARIINQARGYEFQVESTLGREARRFKELLPRFREQPELVVKRLWFETYAKVLNSDTAEIFWVPNEVASMRLSISGLQSVAEARRQKAFRDSESGTFQGQMRDPFRVGGTKTADDLDTNRAKRRLRVDESGELEGMNTPNP